MKLIFLCLSWTQAAEAGWERETCHGATEEENGKRGTENDEKRAEDCCQAFITLIQNTGHLKQQPNNCSYYILPGFVLPATLLSICFLVHQPSWGIFVCLVGSSGFLFVLDWTQHKESSLLFIFECLWLFLPCSRWKEKLNVFFFFQYLHLNDFVKKKNLDKEFHSFLVLLFCLPFFVFFFIKVLCLCFKHWTSPEMGDISIFQKNQFYATLSFCSPHSI